MVKAAQVQLRRWRIGRRAGVTCTWDKSSRPRGPAGRAARARAPCCRPGDDQGCGCAAASGLCRHRDRGLCSCSCFCSCGAVVSANGYAAPTSLRSPRQYKRRGPNWNGLGLGRLGRKTEALLWSSRKPVQGIGFVRGLDQISIEALWHRQKMARQNGYDQVVIDIDSFKNVGFGQRETINELRLEPKQPNFLRTDSWTP